MVNLRGLALYRLNLFHRVIFTTRQQSAQLQSIVGDYSRDAYGIIKQAFYDDVKYAIRGLAP